MYLSPQEISALMSALPVVAESRIVASQVSFKYHYILTNPLIVAVSKSHKVGQLFKSNLLSVQLSKCMFPWVVDTETNVGMFMREKHGLSQWQMSSSRSPELVATAESLIVLSPHISSNME
jgi:hypothetical protein